MYYMLKNTVNFVKNKTHHIKSNVTGKRFCEIRSCNKHTDRNRHKIHTVQTHYKSFTWVDQQHGDFSYLHNSFDPYQ